MNARSRFRVDADWWYASIRRCGSGTRAAAVKAMSLTMWPRKLGSPTPSTVSIAEERGLANWPAMRPTFTAGTPVEYVSTTAIWRITLRRSRMESAENASKDSAQSPPWSRNAWPVATRPSSVVS